MSNTPQTANLPGFPHEPQVQQFKDPYKVRCTGCPSMLMVKMPFAHCPSCHHKWRAKKLDMPRRCPVCQFNLFNWRGKNGVEETSNAQALLA